MKHFFAKKKILEVCLVDSGASPRVHVAVAAVALVSALSARGVAGLRTKQFKKIEAFGFIFSNKKPVAFRVGKLAVVDVGRFYLRQLEAHRQESLNLSN